MLYAVTGRPGEGKSCFAVQHLIVDELENGERPIYTNIWLNRGKIKHYLKRKGVKADLSRLHYLEEHQIRRFWTYGEKGALMVLDEVGEYFNANAWKELSSDPQWDPASYARLHRKVGHETYLIVQELAHIYKQYRDLIGIHIQLVNFSYRKVLGFSGPKLFVAKHFDQLTPHKCIESHVYKFDKKVFKLYDTHQVYDVNSGVKTNEAKKYKDTEKLPDTSSRLKRFIHKCFDFVGKRFWGLIIIVAIFGAGYAIKSAPGFVSGLINKRQVTNEQELETEVKEEIGDTGSDILEPDNVDDSDSVLHSVVRNTQSITGGRTTRTRRGNSPSIRYDSVTKRKP